MSLNTPRKLVLSPLARTARDAEAFARHVHTGQVDKIGEPYIGHLERVAATVRVFAAGLEILGEALQVAWLHDVMEDTPYNTPSDLTAEGFSTHVVCGVWYLTRRDQPYPLFIREIAAGPLMIVLPKLADNLDNADPRRLAHLPEDVRARLSKKYSASIPILREAAFSRGWKPDKPERIRELWPDRSTPAGIPIVKAGER